MKNAHISDKSQYTTDTTENRKLRIQQKSLQAFDSVERKRGVFQSYLANRLQYDRQDLESGKKALFNNSDNYQI